MKLLITGASGFVGRHVVGEALERGHRVWAIVRPGSDLRNVAWAEHAGVTVAPLDLRQPAGLEELIAEVDAVVHLAAVMRGDIEAQRTGTVATTENLLKAMAETVGRRLVLVSSLSVYDYRRIAAFTELDEGSPIEEHPEEREAYCWAKLLQEDLVRRYGREHDLAITILRLGVVIGPDRTWTDQLGLRVLN